MNQETTFIYKYSAKENAEVQAIRKKYLPREESKLEELKRLDCMVQNSGTMESLCVGIGGTLVLGIGMCLAMLPVIGITLPFMSYGGSSVLSMYLMIGMVQSIKSHNQKYFFERENS